MIRLESQKKGIIIKLAEILKQYKDEWVLIEYTKLDEELNVVEGRVLAHSPRKEELYALLSKFKGKNFAIEYTGALPKDVAVMFWNEKVSALSSGEPLPLSGSRERAAFR